jgi:hypothetical protein
LDPGVGKPAAALQGLSETLADLATLRMLTLAGDGRALVRLRHLAESRERAVAHYWFCAAGMPFSGFPVFPLTPHTRRGVYLRRPPRIPLGDLRASTGHLPKIHR